jgi:hypothetical protein
MPHAAACAAFLRRRSTGTSSGPISARQLIGQFAEWGIHDALWAIFVTKPYAADGERVFARLVCAK